MNVDSYLKVNFLSLIVLVIGLHTSIAAWAEEPGEQSAEGVSEDQFKTMSGMSVLGNNEAPKSLVIVPWKSSQIGDGIGIVESLDNRPMSVDRDVFSRQLNYYRIRTEGATDPDWSVSDDLKVGGR